MIKRETDNTKGFVLQKHRALKLVLDKLIEDPANRVAVAIENVGDVYLKGGQMILLEENKDYDSKNFSFVSDQILKTMVYFLDYWYSSEVNKSDNVYFSFYSTNNIAKENVTENTKTLNIEFPDGSILELLTQKKFDTPKLIDACSKLILAKYEQQYKSRTDGILDTLKGFNNEDWTNFLTRVNWSFGSSDHDSIKTELDQLIRKYAESIHLDATGKEHFIRALFSYDIEDRQLNAASAERFVTGETIHLLFLNVTKGQMPADIYRYVDFDYDDLRARCAKYADLFVQAKYAAIRQSGSIPVVLQRFVRLHSPEVKITRRQLERYGFNQASEKMEAVTGPLSSFVSRVKPNFLFGEIGSGKSTQIAQTVGEHNRDGELAILIPSAFLKGKLTTDLRTLTDCIDDFLNSQILVTDGFFNTGFLIKSDHPAVVVVDGLDELGMVEARLLLSHIIKLNESASNLSFIATGRPLELEGLVDFNQWSCVTMIELSDIEIIQLLNSEAVSTGMTIAEAAIDTKQRMEILNRKSELFLLVRTPLMVCLVRDFLNTADQSLTLASLMYKLLLKRLDWDELDNKQNYASFFKLYPLAIHREKLIAGIAKLIDDSTAKQISEITLQTEISRLITDHHGSDHVVEAEAVQFCKTIFLQNQGPDQFTFVSQPIYEIALAVNLAENAGNSNKAENISTNWRAISFAAAICREKSQINNAEAYFASAINELLTSEHGTVQSAAIVTESNLSSLAKLYVDKIALLSFRPFRIWKDADNSGRIDHYSSYVVAKTLILAGSYGFNWFFEEYINPAHPTHTADDNLVESVLIDYLSIKEFSLSADESAKFKEIIPFVLNTAAPACNDQLVPLALVLPDDFQPLHRCRMLALLLENSTTERVAKELLLKQFSVGHKAEVKDALEVVCSKDYYAAKASHLLWFDLFHSDEVNEAILFQSIRNAAKGNDEAWLSLINTIGVQPLTSYLRWSCISGNEVADSSAILLKTKLTETSFYLTAWPILDKTDWFDYSDPLRKQILDEILFKDPIKSVEYLHNKRIPVTSHSGFVSELYLYYFVRLLKLVADSFPEWFIRTIAILPENPVMARYPEIRLAFQELFSERPQYRQYLLEATRELDLRLRFNATCVMVACFPSDNYVLLDEVIHSGNVKRTDQTEWFRFVMKLNFSADALAYIYKNLENYLPQSQCFALCILYHRGYLLSSTDKQKLISNLLGESYGLDINPVIVYDGLESIIAQPEFVKYLVELMKNADAEVSKRAASALIWHHLNALTNTEKAIAYIKYVEDDVMDIIDRRTVPVGLLEDPAFLESVSQQNELIKATDGQDTGLFIYLLAAKGGEEESFKLVKRMVSGRRLQIRELDGLYRGMKSLQKEKPNFMKYIGMAFQKISTYPTFQKSQGGYDPFPTMVMIASEFASFDQPNIQKALAEFGMVEEIRCSLFWRLKQTPVLDRNNYGRGFYILFMQNNTKKISRHQPSDYQKFLLESETMPTELSQLIGSNLIYQTLTIEELKPLRSEGALGNIFVSLTEFCIDQQVDFTKFSEIANISSFYMFGRTRDKSILSAVQLLRSALLDDAAFKSQFAIFLKNKILNPGYLEELYIVHYLRDLEMLQERLDLSMIKKLFSVLMNDNKALELDVMGYVFHEVVDHLNDHDLKDIGEMADKFIQTILAAHSKRSDDTEKNLTLWMLSLVSLYAQDNQTDLAAQGFLKGLESAFTVTSGYNYTSSNGSKQLALPVRDLMWHSEYIVSKIAPAKLQECILNGAKSGTAEIRVICRVMLSLVSRTPGKSPEL